MTINPTAGLSKRRFYASTNYGTKALLEVIDITPQPIFSRVSSSDRRLLNETKSIPNIRTLFSSIIFKVLKIEYEINDMEN